MVYKVARKELMLYILGVRDGLNLLNGLLETGGKQPYYCKPHNLDLRPEQAEDIMMRYAQKYHFPDSTPIYFLLFFGLKETFPCSQSSK